MFQLAPKLTYDIYHSINSNSTRFFNLKSGKNIQQCFIVNGQTCREKRKSNSLYSTRSKGLSLSLKKNGNDQKQGQFNSTLMNPQSLEQIGTVRAKNFISLIKTTHSIHNLGKSLGKSNSSRNRFNQVKQKNANCKYLQNFNTQSYLFMQNSNNQLFFTPEKLKKHKQIDQSTYKIKITTSQTALTRDQRKKYSTSKQSSLDKISKVKQITQRTFIRTKQNSNNSKDLTVKQNDSKTINRNNNITQNCIERTRNKLKNKQSLLKSNHYKVVNEIVDMQIKSKQQFLQSFIQKPMIKSIILSGKQFNNYDDEIDSPVLRLKKRLELNRIDCIFEKETIMSHDVQQTIKSSSIKIQESMIVDRNILSNFRPLMHKLNVFVEGEDFPYKLYLAQEIYSNLIVTLKEQSLQNLNNLTRELLIYQQIDACGVDKKNILELHRFSTDRDSNILIKQPFTETLTEYLENLMMKKISQNEFTQACCTILNILRRNFEQLKDKKVFLRRKFTLHDFVFVFFNLKIQNMSMFELGNYEKINLQQALSQFQLEMQSYYNKISQATIE